MHHKSNYTEHFTSVSEGVDGYSNEQNRALNIAFPKSKLFFQGHSAKIFSAREDDGNSVDLLMNQLEDTKPTALVLGQMSPRDLRFFQLGEKLHFMAGPEH